MTTKTIKIVIATLIIITLASFGFIRGKKFLKLMDVLKREDDGIIVLGNASLVIYLRT
jgi:hypothetical protein